MNSLPIRSVDTSMYEVPNVMLCLGVRLGYAEWPLISESSNTTERALEKKKRPVVVVMTGGPTVCWTLHDHL